MNGFDDIDHNYYHQVDEDTAIYREGKQAEKNGESLDDNPYCPRTQDREHFQWNCGWHSSAAGN